MTPLELKAMLRVLQAEVTALRNRVGALEAREVSRQIVDNATLASKPFDPVRLEQNLKKTDRKMCPKCGVKPNHFFHVKSCNGQKEKEKHGANKEADG